jgi:hypothetical protein
MEERRLEIDSFPQVAEKVRDGSAAGVLEYPADGKRAGCRRELLRVIEPGKPDWRAGVRPPATRTRSSAHTRSSDSSAVASPSLSHVEHSRSADSVRTSVSEFVREHAIELAAILERARIGTRIVPSHASPPTTETA